MKTYIRLFILMLATGVVMSCDTNDPLSELGQSGDRVPQVSLGGVDALYNAGDTISYTVLYWSVSDDFSTVQEMRGDNTVLSGSLTVDDGSGEVSVTLDTTFVTEIALVGEPIPHDPGDYVTSLNNYRKSMEYIVPEAYQLWEFEEVTEENFSMVNDLAHSAEIEAYILGELASNGVTTTWNNLDDIATAADIKIESSLQFQAEVTETDGIANTSTDYGTKVGVIAD